MAEALAEKSGLYVTATPIGNLKDISARALEILRAVDVIACEDTRTTSKLLNHYGITTRTIAYHDHNAARVRPRILDRLGDGQSLALVSDAGTPLVSDPGYKLVSEALDRGIRVTTLPGASAVLAALCVAGLPTDRFFFAGFLPAKKAARKKMLAELEAIPATLVIYESPNRLVASLADMGAILGEARQGAVCRELTKLHEEVVRGGIADLAAGFGARDRVRGEIVIVLAPPGGEAQSDEAGIDRALRKALASLSVKEASHAVSYITGAPRRKVYSRALQIKGEA